VIDWRSTGDRLAFDWQSTGVRLENTVLNDELIVEEQT
jgi:hypothetical protein